jgi:CDP-diacylglycerol--glycerol-3-phosphate 3-phosphatidyltransferase
MIFGLISALLFGIGYTLLAGIFLLFSGMFDTFDGTIARINNKTSKYGAILDSSLDRYVEFMIFLGLLIYYRNDWMFYIVFVALIGSIMVSYTRARAEALGIVEIVGVMQRPERVILLAVGAIINELLNPLLNDSDIILSIAIIIIAIFSNITSIQRILIVKKYEHIP